MGSKQTKKEDMKQSSGEGQGERTGEAKDGSETSKLS